MSPARKHRLKSALLILITILLGLALDYDQKRRLQLESPPEVAGVESRSATRDPASQSALETLALIDIKGRAPKTGYSRSHFGDGWSKIGNCDTRNIILQRDLTMLQLMPDDCLVRSGILNDPYTGSKLSFIRGPSTSQLVQIDHVVALSDAWQKGAQLLTRELREKLANDPLNLMAVEGRANQDKADGDAATWLPANKDYRCSYVARQTAVKYKYSLWVTLAERDAIARVLADCPDQILPTS